MNERVYTVCPVEYEGVLQEPCLHIEFEEDVESLFEVDDLEGVPAGDVDSAFDHCYCGECATELIHLSSMSTDVLRY